MPNTRNVFVIELLEGDDVMVEVEEQSPKYAVFRVLDVNNPVNKNSSKKI